MSKDYSIVTSEKVKTPFYIWLASIILFDLSIFWANGNFLTSPTIYLIIALFSAVTGVLTFIIHLFSAIKQKSWGWVGIDIGIVAIFFAILFTLPNSNNKLNPINSVNLSDSNSFVDCPVNVSCGGGTKRMTQAECVNSTCCQVGTVWVTLDKDECKLKQQDFTQSNKPAAVQRIQVQQPNQAPKVQGPQTLCCKENCNSITGRCNTSCTMQYVCF